MAKLAPTYSKELSIFEQETLREIETFRAARKDWLLSNAEKNTPTIENESSKESKVCNANFRWPWLRKLKPPLTSCTVNKTLRPLRYYTLKPRTSGPDDGAKRRYHKQRFRRYEMVKPTMAEDEEEKTVKTKHRDKAEVWKPRPGPCQEALNRLRAAHFEDGLIESCRCDDGREVTVVIKGICLCDKNSLNNVKLNKVCQRFCKVGVTPEQLPKEEPQKEGETDKNLDETSKELSEEAESKTSIEKLHEKLSHMYDSNEFNSGGLSTSVKAAENSEATSSDGKASKKVDFTAEDIERKMQPRKFSKLGSDLTIYRKLSVSDETLEDSPSGSVKNAKSVGQFDTTKEPESAKQSDTVKESEYVRQSDTGKESESVGQLDTIKESESVLQSDTVKVPESVKQSDTIKKPESVKQSDAVKESEPVKDLNKKQEKFRSETQGDVSNWSFKSLDLENLKKSSAVRDLTEPTNKQRTSMSKTNLLGSSENILLDSSEKENTRSLKKIESEGVSTSRVTVLDDKIKSLKPTRTKSASTISLFKNYQQLPSDLGLTQEQKEVLKKNEKVTTTDQG